MSNKLDSLALPEVAVIRKGDAKVKTVKNGREVEMVGPDLKDRFRVSFFPGADEYRRIFEQKYKTLKPEKIRAMVLSRSVWDSWSWANEAYSAGRMVAKADDEHFLTWRDPLTGEYKVKDGEPYTEFEPGMVITYARDGKKYELKLRTVGRLRLFIPEMERLVQFTLKTTSYYDRLNIDRQLHSIQTLADTLSGGNAAGIPFHVFRMPQEVSWNKPDGSASRVEKWLVNIEADSDWVKAATARLSKFALTGEVMAGLLQPPSSVSGPVEPEDEDIDENPNDAEVLDGVAVDIPAPRSDYSPDLIRAMVKSGLAPDVEFVAHAFSLSALPVEVQAPAASGWLKHYTAALVDESKPEAEAVAAADATYLEWAKAQQDKE